MLGIYLHIPFCSSICSYCNFNRGLFDGPLKERYVTALAGEIQAAGDGTPADTIFFGGGTPSLLEPAEIGGLIQTCRETYAVAADAEITLETNPETATPERLAAFRAAGVNRISFGVQSFDNGQLERLGRIHSADRAAAAVREARAAGFTNLSFDLMFWLPGQSRASWLDTVDRAIDLGPDHLSLYLLELYPNAPLKEAMARVSVAGPADAAAWAQASDDEAAEMYLAALERLDAAGLVQYEISNVARPGFWSRHNVKYWQGGQWRGFGCGAHSTAGGARWKNVASTVEYVEAVTSGREIARDWRALPHNEQVEDALFTGLRLTAGIITRNFLARYGVDPWARYGEALAPYVQGEWMWKTSDAFGLTRSGMLVANEILATFV
jgi:oxygen-independent coproporphyrinogen III oxidase